MPVLHGRGPRGRQPVGGGRHGAADALEPSGRTASPRSRRAEQAQPGRQLGLLVGSQEEIHRRVAPLQDARVVGTDRAAREHHAQRRVGRLELLQQAHAADDLLLGRLADGAGVDDDEVGLLETPCLRAAGRQQRARHLLRVGVVHLAAERPDVEPGQDPVVGGELREGRPSGRAPVRGSSMAGGAASSTGRGARWLMRRSGPRGGARRPRPAPRWRPAPWRSRRGRRGSRCHPWRSSPVLREGHDRRDGRRRRSPVVDLEARRPQPCSRSMTPHLLGRPRRMCQEAMPPAAMMASMAARGPMPLAGDVGGPTRLQVAAERVLDGCRRVRPRRAPAPRAVGRAHRCRRHLGQPVPHGRAPAHRVGARVSVHALAPPGALAREQGLEDAVVGVHAEAQDVQLRVDSERSTSASTSPVERC